MKTFLTIVFGALLLLAASCSSSVSTISVDVMYPSAVTFPKSVSGLLVVDNAGEVEADKNHYFVDANRRRYRLSLEPADSLSSIFSETVAGAFASAHYFPEVRIFDNAVQGRNSSSDLFPISEQDSLREGDPDRLILSIDSVYIQSQMQDRLETGEDMSYYRSTLDVSTGALVRLYVPGHSRPESFWANDSIFWEEMELTAEAAHSLLPSYYDAFMSALGSLSLRVVSMFTPHIETENRYLYETSHPAMQDAMSYWNSGKYEDASFLWEYMYEKSKKESVRARAAANLSVYYELNDDFPQAIKWCEESLRLFGTDPEENEIYILTLEHALRMLNLRRENADLLQKQIGRYR